MHTNHHSSQEIPLKTDTKASRFFILKPWKYIAIDAVVLITANAIFIYALLWFIPDSSLAMVCSFFVIIAAIRGGLLPGVLLPFLLFITNTIIFSIPPHTALPVSYYFDQRIPGYLVGLSQSLVTGIVVGYISSLSHRLKQEILLRKSVQNALEQKIAELDAFGHTVAHNLRNPIMVINISSQSLIEDLRDNTNKSVKKKLAFISESTEHMVNIVESILLLAGLKKISPEQFSIFPMSYCIDEALNRMKFNIETNDVIITQPQHWPSIFGYPRWITEVWVNYINNALKYGLNPNLDHSPRIELGFDTSDSTQPDNEAYIKFWVKDFGEGISNEKKSSLFQEFTRIHTSKQKGYGLGLSIIKSIITRLGGTVGVVSNPGEGSLFYFTLPAKPVSFKM